MAANQHKMASNFGTKWLPTQFKMASYTDHNLPLEMVTKMGFTSILGKWWETNNIL